MKLEIKPGRYVVAVSGGVDSMVLLDLLRLYPGVQPIVAHFDHGIRENSAEDRAFVHEAARRHGLPFVFDCRELGPAASEAAAREARYAFLRAAQKASGAAAIVTAHHLDDVLETAILNLLRGTGRKGLASLTSGEGIVRPLLRVPKSEIIDYARRHHLLWREDSTNTDTNYLRNHVRHNILPQWSETDRRRLLELVRQQERLNGTIDGELAARLQPELDRKWFIMLPHAVAREVMAAWLRTHNLRDFDRPTIERLTVAAKILAPGKRADVLSGVALLISREKLALDHSER